MASPGFFASADLLSTFKQARGVTATPPGVTVGGGFLSFAIDADPATIAAQVPAHVFVGIIVSNEQTQTQLPRPELDLHADWMWWQTLYVSDNEPFAHVDGSRSPLIRWRAKRRMEEIGQNLYLVFGADSADGLTYNVSWASSTLLIMP